MESVHISQACWDTGRRPLKYGPPWTLPLRSTTVSVPFYHRERWAKNLRETNTSRKWETQGEEAARQVYVSYRYNMLNGYNTFKKTYVGGSQPWLWAQQDLDHMAAASLRCQTGENY